MKAKIYFLNPEGDGEDIKFFPTQAALHSEMREMMRRYIGEEPQGRRETEWRADVRALLTNDDDESLHEAWDLWHSNLPLDDTYWSEGEEEIEVEIPADHPAMKLLRQVAKEADKPEWCNAGLVVIPEATYCQIEDFIGKAP